MATFWKSDRLKTICAVTAITLCFWQDATPLVIPSATHLWTENVRLIPMCWDHFDGFGANTQGLNDAKAFVQTSIQEYWIDRLNLRITWEDCPTAGSAKHVRAYMRIGDSVNNGFTKKYGTDTLSVAQERTIPPPNDAPGLLIGFRSDWNANAATRASFRTLVLHEFGHILGFGHEQDRPDEQSPCYAPATAGGTPIGPVDPKSLMGLNFCATALGVPTLDDVNGARSIYGRQDVAIRGALLVGKYRSQIELNSMLGEDQRNTLIVELVGRTNRDTAHYQAMDNWKLAGAGAIVGYVRAAGIRTDEQIKTLSDDDIRNIVIVEVADQTGREDLLASSNLDLVRLGLGGDRSYIRGVLLLGKFRTLAELHSMSADDQRNTLIVELSNRTNQSVGYYQSLNDEALGGVGANLVWLRETHIRDDNQIKTMSDDDMRNTLIVEIAKQTGLDLELQRLTTIQLVGMSLGIFP